MVFAFSARATHRREMSRSPAPCFGTRAIRVRSFASRRAHLLDSSLIICYGVGVSAYTPIHIVPRGRPRCQQGSCGDACAAVARCFVRCIRSPARIAANAAQGSAGTAGSVSNTTACSAAMWITARGYGVRISRDKGPTRLDSNLRVVHDGGGAGATASRGPV